MSAPAVKSCDGCGRPVFSMYRGDVTITSPARVEKVEANGNIVAVCRCNKRVIWFKVRRTKTGVSLNVG